MLIINIKASFILVIIVFIHVTSSFDDVSLHGLNIFFFSCL